MVAQKLFFPTFEFAYFLCQASHYIYHCKYQPLQTNYQLVNRTALLIVPLTVEEIVGVVEIIKTAFLDKTDNRKKFVAVQVKYKKKLQKPVSLKKIKASQKLT